MVIFHDPIDTKGMTIDDLSGLKSAVYSVINEELEHRNDGKGY